MRTIKNKFINSLKRGTGEAVLILKNHPRLDFSTEIIKAAIKNYTPNIQDEGTRSKYIFDLIKLSPNQPKIRNAILKGLSEEKNNSDTLGQLFGIVFLFAKQKDKEFHKAIYKRYFRKPIMYSDSLGEEEILSLDGIDGLKFITETRGKNLVKNPEYWEDGSVVSSFHEDNPKINAYKELKKSARTNPFIKIYLDKVLSYKESVFKSKKMKVNAKLIKRRIDENKPIPLSYQEIDQLTKSEIKKVADDFLKETLRNKKDKYLRVFSVVKFPYQYKPILQEAKRIYNYKDRLIESACNALSIFKGNDIRRFAMSQIPITKFPSIYCDLLISNYKNGDGKMLAKLLKKEKLQWKIHSLAMNYINIYEANKTKDCKEPLIELYNKLTCGRCRNRIINIMIKNNVLPNYFKKEIKYDSYEETRRLFINLNN